MSNPLLCGRDYGAPRANANGFAGFHTHYNNPNFEVFWREPGRGDNLTTDEWELEPGWYWWSCCPGCLPDSEPNGPFHTSRVAWLDARQP